MPKTAPSSRFSKQFIKRLSSHLALTTLLSVGIYSGTKAANVYWDADLNAGNNSLSGTGLGKTGTWDLTTPAWWNGTSTTTDNAWANGDAAIFDGTPGTVMLGTPITASGLTFKTSGFLVTGLPANTLTLSGPATVEVEKGVATISAVLAGSSGVSKTGTGLLILRGANTYTGVTTISDGNVLLAPLVNDGSTLGSTTAGNNTVVSNGGTLSIGPDALGTGAIGAGVDPITLNGQGFRNLGALRMMLGVNSATVGSAITIGSSTRVHTDVGTGQLTLGSVLALGANNLTFSGLGNQVNVNGVVSGSGTLTKEGLFFLHLASANNTFTGTLNSNLGLVYAGNAVNSLGSVAALNFRNSTLQIIVPIAASANTRVNDLAALSLAASRLFLEVSGTPTAAQVFTTEETVGAVTLRPGASSIDVEQGIAGAINRLSLTSLTREKGATVLFAGTGLGTNAQGSVVNIAGVAMNDGVVGGWATYGATANFVKYGANGYTELLAADYVTNPATSTYAATQNIRINDTNYTLVTGTTTINSLNFQSDTGRSLTGVAAGSALVVDSGGILMTRSSTGTSQVHTLGATTGLDTVTAGEGASGSNDYELFFHAINAGGNVYSRVINNGSNALSLVKAGSGTLSLFGANSYTGTTFINEGVLRDSVGDRRISLGGGALVIAGSFSTNSVLEIDTDFTQAFGTGANQVQITGGVGAGFSAFGRAIDINFGGTGAEVVWGSAGFNPGIFTLNAGNATHVTTLVNSLNLGGEQRYIRLDGNASGGNPAVMGILRGDVLNGGIVKRGGGVLVIENAKTYMSGTQISDGVVWLRGAGSLGQNVNGNDIMIGSSGNLRVETPDLVGSNQMIILQNSDNAVPAGVAFGSGYGDGSGINFASFAATGGVANSGGNNIFIVNDQAASGRRVAFQLSGATFSTDIVARAQAVAPNTEIWLGATAANGVFNGNVLSASVGNYRLGSGLGTLIIEKENILTGGAGLIVGATDGTARTNLGGIVYLPQAQNFSGSILIGNAGVLIVAKNASLGSSTAAITLNGGDLRLNAAVGSFNGVDTQYGSRDLNLTGNSTVRTQTLGGAGFGYNTLDQLTLSGADRTFTFTGTNQQELRFTGTVTLNHTAAANQYFDIAADNVSQTSGMVTFEGVVDEGGTGSVGAVTLYKRNGGMLVLAADNAYGVASVTAATFATQLQQGVLALTNTGAAGVANSNIQMSINNDRIANLHLRPAGATSGSIVDFDFGTLYYTGGNAGSQRIVTVGAAAPGSENVTVRFGALRVDAVSGVTPDLIFDGFNGYRTTIAGGMTLNTNVNFRPRGTILTIEGAIDDATGTFNIAKAEQGTLRLNGNNLYSGTTTLNNGYLIAGHANAFGNGTGTIQLAGTAFSQLLLGGTLTLSRNLEVTATSSVQTIGGLDTGAKTISGNIALTSRGVNFSAVTGGNLTITGTVSGANTITKAGSGTVILDSTAATGNSYSAGTIVSQGTLIGRAKTSGSPFGTGALTVNNGTLKLEGLVTPGANNTATAGALNLGGGGARVTVADAAADGFSTGLSVTSLSRTGAATVVFTAERGVLGTEELINFTGTAPTLVNGILGPWAVVKNGSADATFAALSGSGLAEFSFGPNTGSIDAVTGNAQVFNASTGGTLTDSRSVYAFQTDSNIDLSTHRLSVGNATLGGFILNDGADITASAGGNLYFGTAALSVFVADGGTSSISAPLTNFRNNLTNTIVAAPVFTKFGAGTLELGAANAFQGNVQVNEGVLSLTTANALATSGNLNAVIGSVVTIQPGGTVKLNGNNQEFANLAGSIVFTPKNVGGTLDLGTATLIVGRDGGNQTFSGQIIGGAGSKLVKVGGGRLTLDNFDSSIPNSLAILDVAQGFVTSWQNDNSWATPTDFASAIPSSTTVYLRGGEWEVRANGDATSNQQRVVIGNNVVATGGNSFLDVDRFGNASNKLLTFGTLSLDVTLFGQTGGNTFIARFDGLTTLNNHGRIQTDTQLVLGGGLSDNLKGFTLNKIGSSDLAIAGDNSSTFSGGVVVSSGTLLFGSRGTDDIRYPGTTFVPSSTANVGAGDIVLNQGSFLNGTSVVRINAPGNILTGSGQRVVVFGSDKTGTSRVEIGTDAPLTDYGLRSTTNGVLSLGIGDAGLYTIALDQARMGNGKWSMGAFQNSFYTATTLGAGIDNVYRFGGTSANILNLVAANVLTGTASVELGRRLVDFGALPQNTQSQIRVYGGQDYTGDTTIHRGNEFGSIGNVLIFHGDLATPTIDIYGRLEARGDGRFTKDDGTASATAVNIRPGGALRLDYNMDTNDQFVIARLTNSNLGLETTEDKWADTAGIVLDGGQLALVNSSGRVNQETVGTITIRGGAGIFLERNGTNGQIVLTTSGITRSAGATLSIRENNDELGSINLQSMKMFIDNSTFTGAAINGILPVWMINATRNAFLGYSAETGLVNAPFTATGTGQAFLNSQLATSITNYTVGDAALTLAANTYAIRVAGTSAITGSQINIHSGGLITTGAVTFGSAVFFGNATTAAEAVLFSIDNTVTFNGIVTANNFTRSGNSTTVLSNAANVISGNVQVNGGTLIASNPGSLGTTSTITLHADHLNNTNGGQMPILGLRTTSGDATYAQRVIIAANVPLARITPDRTVSGGGTIFISALDIQGTTSDTGTTLQIENTNSYNLTVSGATTIGGTADVGIRVNANTLALAGTLTSAVEIIKTGDGVLRLDGNNDATFSSAVTLNRGEIRLNGLNTGGISQAEGTGIYTLNFGTLRLASTTSATYLSGTNQSLTVAGQVNIVPDRIISTGPAVTLTIGAAGLEFRTENSAYVNFDSASFGDGIRIASELVIRDQPFFRSPDTTLVFNNVIRGNGKLTRGDSYIVQFGGISNTSLGNVANTNWTGGFTSLQGYSRVNQASTAFTFGTGPVINGPTSVLSLNSLTNIQGGAVASFGSGRTTPTVLAISQPSLFTTANLDSLFPAANNTSRAGVGGILGLDSITLTGATTFDLSAFQDGYWSIGAAIGGSTYSGNAGSLLAGTGDVYRISGAGSTLTINPSTAGSKLFTGTAQVLYGRPDAWHAAGYNAVIASLGTNLDADYTGGTTITRARDIGGGWYQTGVTVNGGNPTATSYRTPLGTGQVDVYGHLRFAGANGGLLNASGGNYTTLVTHAGSRITFDNRTASVDPSGEGRYDDAAALTLNASHLQLRGIASLVATNREDIGALTIERGSQIRLDRETNGYVTLGAASLNRGTHGTLTLNHNAILGVGADATANTENIIIVGGVTNTNNMVAPWIVSRNTDQFVKYDATNGFQIITQGTLPTNYRNPASAVTTLDTTVATLNNGTEIIDLGLAAATQTLGANLDIYALRLARDINVSATGAFNQITVQSGGIIGLANSPTINADLKFGATGAGEALIFARQSTLQINGQIQASQLTKFGSGFLNIRSDQPLFAGNWVVNEGGIQFLTPGAVGSATSEVILNGSTMSDDDDRQDGGASILNTELRYNFNSGTPDEFVWNHGKVTSFDNNFIYAATATDRNQLMPGIDLQTTATAAGGLQSGLIRFRVDGLRSTLRTGAITMFDHYTVSVDAGGFSSPGATSGVKFGAVNNAGLYDLIKIGDGMLTLIDNSATFTGNRFMYVDEGAVRVLSNGSFGAAGGTAVVSQGGALEIAVANFSSLATIDMRPGSIERWAVDGARSGNVTLGAGVHLQVMASQTGTKTITLNGGSIMGYLPLDWEQVAVINTLAAGITVNLTGDSFLGQPFPANATALYDMGKLNTTTNLNPSDIGLRGSYLQIDGNITGTGNLTKTGQDLILLNGSNSYVGITTVTNGVLQIGRKDSLPTGTALVMNGSSGTFDINGYDQEVSELSGPNGTVTNGAFVNNTFTVNQTTTTSFAGTIAGNVNLNKSGSGLLGLTSANSFRGTTVVAAGELHVALGGVLSGTESASIEAGATFRVNGTVQSEADVSVSGVLRGTGTVGAVNVEAGGEVAPGSSTTPAIGILNTGDFTLLTATSKLSIEINKPTVGTTTAGVEYDQVNVTGSTLINGDLALTITNSTGIAVNGDIFYIILNDEADATTGAFASVNGVSGFDPMDFSAGGMQWAISYSANAGTGSFQGGNDVALMAVPEPNSLAMLAGSLGLSLGLQRFRRSRRS